MIVDDRCLKSSPLNRANIVLKLKKSKVIFHVKHELFLPKTDARFLYKKSLL
jgi:hypothetical protein